MPRGGRTSDPEQLMATAQAGDSQALGQLLALYNSYLRLLAQVQIGRRLQGKVDAGDLVQETFLEAHRHFETFRGHTEGEFVAWLRQILAGRLGNLLRRYLGTQGRDIRLECELAAAMDDSSRLLDYNLAAPHTSPSQQASQREQAVLLADALAKLPPDSRAAIVLRHLAA